MFKLLAEKISAIIHPRPEEQEKLGFEPNFFINALRRLADLSVILFRLNGNNRFVTELHQKLDPTIEVELPQGVILKFVTGHGRLLWRATTFLEEQPYLIEWIDSFNQDDCFYDIGANVGNYSIYAAATKKVKVFAFEPEINNLQLLYANIYKNKLFNYCVPVPFGCGNTTGLVEFYVRDFSKGDAMHNFGRKAVYLEEQGHSFIQQAFSMRIDELIKVFNLPMPTKVKIDVDTNELLVLEGLKSILPNIKEVFIELDLDLEEHQAALELLKNNNFSLVGKRAMDRKFNNTIANYLFRQECE